MLIAPETPEGETLRGRVLRVFDGDGFLTRVGQGSREGERELSVRFGFIDAPEMAQPGGREAQRFLASLIQDQWVDLAILWKMDTDGIIDRYGRVVAVPYLQQQTNEVGEASTPWRRLLSFVGLGSSLWRNIELEMVLNGWAWVLDRYGPDERYFDALEDAQHHRRGIWSRDDNIHPWEFKRQSRKGIRRITSPMPRRPANAELGHCPAPECEGSLVERSGRFGSFYGCSTFPKCRYSSSKLR